MEDPQSSLRIDNVFTSLVGPIISGCSGSLSAICSILIIYMIILSQNRLSSTYHRLMFCMSVFDIIGSISMALTTLPMPSDDEIVNAYGYAGTRLGTIRTCELQAFFMMVGTYGTHSYTAALCIYYLCILGYQRSFDAVKKHVEPYLHLGVGLIIASASLPGLFLGLYNPSPLQSPWSSLGKSYFLHYLSESQDKHLE